jgi:hypothetical protein
LNFIGELCKIYYAPFFQKKYNLLNNV